ncbi:hypothetical protein CBR_g54223 [Chara braunii]|uniref:Uncharacterized protein n=1 Tax=Chara braunii TaxID=69332 RepID=A0A388K7A8_CHABU|nr:hypothetical protein CBR_g54223 [Chara braunii]|eukprot:GBG65928.1 hypothetical protein CBR_g54223 [Chara braunii]
MEVESRALGGEISKEKSKQSGLTAGRENSPASQMRDMDPLQAEEGEMEVESGALGREISEEKLKQSGLTAGRENLPTSQMRDMDPLQVEEGEMEVESGALGRENSEEKLKQSGVTARRRNLPVSQMMDMDPLQAAFDSEPVDVDLLPANASTSPEGLDSQNNPEGEEEGAPPLHLPVEQKLVAIADGLMGNLKAKYGPLTDNFWDKTYLELFPMLDPSAALKNVLENGVQAGVRWTEAWHRLTTIVFARFQSAHAETANEEEQDEARVATEKEQAVRAQEDPLALQQTASPPDDPPTWTRTCP